MSKIKLELPADNPSALLRTANMLVGMADDLRNSEQRTEGDTSADLTVVPRPEPQPAGPEYPDGPDADGFPGGDERMAEGHGATGVNESPGEEQALQHNTTEVDAEGLPYDPRIHSRGKTFYKSGKKAGCWKKARGVEQEKVDRVEAELRQLMAIPSGGGSQPDFEPKPQDQQADNSAAEQAFGGGPQPEPEPGPEPQAQQPEPQPEQAAATDDTPATFQDFMHRVTAGINAGTINTSQVTEVCKKHGVAALPMLATRPDLIPSVWPEVKAQMGG